MCLKNSPIRKENSFVFMALSGPVPRPAGALRALLAVLRLTFGAGRVAGLAAFVVEAAQPCLVRAVVWAHSACVFDRT